MVTSYPQTTFEPFRISFKQYRIVALLFWMLLLFGVASAQSANDETVVIQGTNEGTVFGLGESLKITGTVKQGAMSIGGDVIVEGVVEGDVATIGGSVIQKAGSRIGGDIIVLGGSYLAEETPANRMPPQRR